MNSMAIVSPDGPFLISVHAGHDSMVSPIVLVLKSWINVVYLGNRCEQRGARTPLSAIQG